MPEIDYLDFDLQIEREGEGYRALVLSSPAGQAANDFRLPFSDLELENFVLRMSRTHRGARRLGTPEIEAARAFGGRLFEAVFAGEVRGCLRSSLDLAAGQNRGLRLRLHLTAAPELVDLPWEYLYSPALNRFFALSSATPLVRYLDLPERIAPLTVRPPLRLLAMIASPRDYPALDVEQEWVKLRGALGELEAAGLVQLERLEPPTLGALQKRLRASPCHILHFVGHGAFDEATQDGILLLEDEEGRGRPVSAQDLGVLLHDHPSLRLVVLNACEGARTSRSDPFAGTAQSLVQQGMPAVVAMQFEISDAAAIVIGHEFYAALASGYPVDAALGEARKAAFTGGSGGAEWGTPVLYLRAVDGRIFGLKPARGLKPAAPAAPAVAVGADKPTAASAPAGPTSAPAPAAAAAAAEAPDGAAPARRRGSPGRKLWLALAGLAGVAALIFGLARLLPVVTERGGQGAAPAASSPAAIAQGATQARSSPAPAAATPAAAATARPLDQLAAQMPRVFSSTALVHDLIPQSDGVWAATSGGLVRWRADGTSRVFTVADGLPFNHTTALLAMPDGSFWAAANWRAVHVSPSGDGLGQVQRYSDAEGLPLGESPVFMLDRDQAVWLASTYSQPPVERFDGSVWRPPAIPVDDPALQGLRPEISALLRDRHGALWAGLQRDGILRWDGKAWTHFGAGQGVPAGVSRLLEDREGTLWAAAGDAGLLRFDPTTEHWQRTQLPQADAPVNWLSQLPDASLWASGNNIILKSTDGGAHWSPVATKNDGLDYPTVVVQDGAQRVWAATADGLGMFDGQEWRVWRRPGEPAGYEMGRISPAPDGRFWVLPEYGGTPSVVDPGSGEVALPADWPPDLPEAMSVAFAGDTTWAGTTGGLLQLRGGSLRRWTQADGLPDDRAGALLATPDTLWIGTHAGLASLDLKSGRITTAPATAGHYIDVLALAPDGALWAGSHWGDNGSSSAVERFAGKDHQIWTNAEAPLNSSGSNWVRGLAADDQGGMWLGMSNGVHRWDGQSWVAWGEARGGPGYDVFALLPSAGAMWTAGHSDKLSRWHSQDGWQHFRIKGLTGDVISMYVSGDGALWLATEDGLLRYGP